MTRETQGTSWMKITRNLVVTLTMRTTMIMVMMICHDGNNMPADDDEDSY